MNDEILILVSGGATNKQIDRLLSVLRDAGCKGKIASRKISPHALRRAQAAIENVEQTEARHRNTAWR